RQPEGRRLYRYEPARRLEEGRVFRGDATEVQAEAMKRLSLRLSTAAHANADEVIRWRSSADDVCKWRRMRPVFPRSCSVQARKPIRRCRCGFWSALPPA